jgi:hypothetical protein
MKDELKKIRKEISLFYEDLSQNLPMSLEKQACVDFDRNESPKTRGQ